MSFSSSSATTALFNGGCKHDAQCAQTNNGICNGHIPMWNGITQRGICYKTGKLSRSACVCGVFVNHITEKKQCNNKMLAPGWTTLAKDSYAAFIEEQEGKKGVTDWFRSGKRFPYWTSDKTNGQYPPWAGCRTFSVVAPASRSRR